MIAMKRRATGPRRKTGCHTCRLRHVRCDEKKPQCSNCARKGYDCVQPEFFVMSSTPAAEPPVPHCESPNSTPVTIQPSDPSEYCDPLLTSDVFSLSKARLSAVRNPEASSIRTVDLIDHQTIDLLRLFEDGISTWMDLFDHSQSYQREGSRRALHSALIRESICSMSAKQLELTKSRSVWGPIAAHRYGKSLRLLIEACASEDADQQEILMATILLSSVELLTAPGSDHKRHLAGAATLVESCKTDASCVGLDRASFWIYARLDLAMALMNECPTELSPDDWNASWQRDEANEDVLANEMIWLCSRVVNFVFAKRSTGSERSNLGIWESLRDAVDAWFEAAPYTCRGVCCGEKDRHGFQHWWFPVPAAAAAIATYHEAKLLLLCDFRQRNMLRQLEKDELDAQIQHHAMQVGSIGISKITDGALVQLVQPLYFAAKYIRGLDRRARIWSILSRIESDLGFHTASRVAQLQRLEEKG